MSMLSKRVWWVAAVALVCVGQMADNGLARPDQGDSVTIQAEPTKVADQDEGTTTGVPADWSDDFESYPDGSNLQGLGGWQGWDNNPAWAASLQELFSLSPNSAVDIAAPADLIHRNNLAGGHHTGQWDIRAWMYVPTGLSSTTYFLVQKEYNDGGPYQWSIQIKIEPDGTVHGDCGASDNCTPTTVVWDTWIEIHANVDLDADWVELYYNGSLMGAYQWTTGVFGGDPAVCPAAGCIQAFDLFAENANSVYYDDMEITFKGVIPVIPTVSEWGLIGIGLLTVIAGGIVFGRRRPGMAGEPDADS